MPVTTSAGRGIPLSVTASNLTHDEARERASFISDVSYGVRLDLSDGDPETFGSTTTVTFTVDGQDRATFLDLANVSLRSVTVDGQEVAVEEGTGRVALQGLSGRTTVVVDARCAFSRSGVGLHRFTDPVDDEVFCYTQFEPQDAHRVFACFDQPDLKARITMEVVAPAGWEVISNARVAERPDEGQAGEWRFAETTPISTYIAAVVAGPYHRVSDRHGDIELGIYCRRSMAEHLDPDEIFTITKQGFDWFTAQFDMPYPFDKYDQLFVPEFNFGAMENPGCVTFSEQYVFRSRVTQAAHLSRANTILHEMAHMWFGDLVTMRWWDDLWLNESFATFTAHAAVAEATRFGEDSWADFAHSMKAWAYQQDQLPSTHPIVADIPDTDSVMANFDGITYAKGASVLKQLHAWVGADAFTTGVRDYFRTHAHGNAELGDFLRALEGPSGRNLDEWAAEWLQTAGVATLSVDLDTDAEGTIRSAVVRQEADPTQPTLRAHRVALGLYDTVDGQLHRSDQVTIDVVGAATEVPELVGRSRPELLLVNDEDLAYAKVRLDEESTATLHRSLGTLHDGVARAVVWGALWDSTRDGELPARRFADLVCEHGPVESDISVLQTLLRQAASCADRYGDPENRLATQTRLAQVARAGIDRAEPGGDRQLVWVRQLVATRTDPDFGRALLDGTADVPGLRVDPDLRWYVLGHLAATGHADAAMVDAELQRDPTDLGRRGAEAARAALPLVEAKAAAWERARDTGLAMHTRRAALRGFWQVGQEELLAPYASTRWVEVLPELWNKVSPEEGLTMTEAFYPTVIVDESVVAAADRALDEPVHQLAARTVAESRDSTLRALRARKVDQAG